MLQFLFPLLLLLSQIRWQIESVPSEYDNEKLNKFCFIPNTEQFEQFGPKCKAESLNFSLTFEIDIRDAELFGENCKWAFICYTSSFGDNVKPHMKLRNENPNHNNVDEACGGFHGVGLEICRKQNASFVGRPLELSFRKQILPECENPKIHIDNNTILVEFKSLLTLWNKHRMEMLKQIQFYNGLNALQKIANHWLVPIDIFGGLKNGNFQMFYLAPDGITVLEKNELLNSSKCTFKTTTPKTTTTHQETKSNSAISTQSTQSGAEPTEVSTTTDSEPPLEWCDKECESELKAILDEIDNMKTCEMQELPSDAKERENIDSYLKKSVLLCSNFFEHIYMTLGMARELLNSVKKRCNDASAADVEIHKIPIRRWESPIHYIFGSTVEEKLRKAIQAAIKMIEGETCIRFEEVEKIDERLGSMPYLRFMDSYLCSSHVGQVVPKYDQKVVLFSTQFNVGGIVHTILHTLGLEHEHVREDRDEKIWINWQNIKTGRTDFDLLATNQYGTPYDFGSIMHFGPNARQADDKKFTIITKNADFQHTIGQRAKMSFKDAKLLNKRYKCQNENCTTSVNCLNGGYPNPNKCGTCKCPDPFEGDTCADYKCKEMKLARGGEPVYNSNDHKCVSFKTYMLRDLIPVIAIKEIQLAEEHNCTMTCQHSFVEIKTSDDDPSATGARICCTNVLPKNITSKLGTSTYLLLQGEIEVELAYKWEKPNGNF